MLGTLLMGATSLAGIGMSLMGGMNAAHDLKMMAEASGHIFSRESEINLERRKMMELSAKRMQLQNLRNTQIARSMALSSSVGQGAQYGSALPGAYGQLSGQENRNALGINQNEQIGNKVFDLNTEINSWKANMAQFRGNYASDMGMVGLGQGILGAAPAIGRIGGSIPGMMSGIFNA